MLTNNQAHSVLGVFFASDSAELVIKIITNTASLVEFYCLSITLGITLTLIRLSARL